MITIEMVIAAQDKSRVARAKFLASEPGTPSETRAFNRSDKADYRYGCCLRAYMAQTGLGKLVYAHIEAERARLGR